jgi:hypothetical protein
VLITNVLNRLTRRLLSSRLSSRRSPTRHRRPCALGLETLESRLCPSSWTNIGPPGSPVWAEAIDPGNPETIYTDSFGAGFARARTGE